MSRWESGSRLPAPLESMPPQGKLAVGDQEMYKTAFGAMVAADKNYGETGWVCDVCEQRMGTPAMDEQIWHAADFDCCDPCAAKQQRAQQRAAGLMKLSKAELVERLLAAEPAAAGKAKTGTRL